MKEVDTETIRIGECVSKIGACGSAGSWVVSGGKLGFDIPTDNRVVNGNRRLTTSWSFGLNADSAFRNDRPGDSPRFKLGTNRIRVVHDHRIGDFLNVF
jgi:hypothetical protein